MAIYLPTYINGLLHMLMLTHSVQHGSPATENKLICLCCLVSLIFIFSFSLFSYEYQIPILIFAFASLHCRSIFQFEYLFILPLLFILTMSFDFSQTRSMQFKLVPKNKILRNQQNKVYHIIVKAAQRKKTDMGRNRNSTGSKWYVSESSTIYVSCYCERNNNRRFVI